MKSIIVLGAGLVGSAIAIDLQKKYKVTSADINQKNLNYLKSNYNINTIEIDFNNEDALSETISVYDLVISAVPGFLGYKTLERVIRSAKNVVDISFFPEDAFELDKLAKEYKVTAVVDCGVAPGMSNLICGYHNNLMNVLNFECYVGGLPKLRILPFQYKAPFSPVDVIEEYTRPARIRENGKILSKPALSEREYLYFDNIGTLEAFNTDGLRTLLKTTQIPNMKEKTLRYPGHIDIILLLRECGFLSEKEIDFNGNKIIPLQFTSKILFPQWKLNKNDEEFTVMRIIIEGIENQKEVKYIYNLFDYYDINTGISSMARTTGYTATAVSNFILEGKFEEKGVLPPELLSKNSELFNFIFQYLEERKIFYERKKIEK